MSGLEEEVNRLKAALQQAGLCVTGEKSIPYGKQLLIVAGSAKANINVYSGKKGISKVVGGASGILKEQLEAICSGQITDKVVRANDIPGFEQFPHFDGCWIGGDESGKGDVFGPLVVAAVMVDQVSARQLLDMGIRDSKLLTDEKISYLAENIRELCKNRFVELELTPPIYNTMYQDMQRQGYNLNHLLASAHAQVLENLLAVAPCQFALIDQFADEKVIQARLLPLGRTITVMQAHRGERNVAVAAASILARDRFVQSMNELSEEFAVKLPKGASAGVKSAIKEFVALHGKEQLVQVGKLHFRTFEECI